MSFNNDSSADLSRYSVGEIQDLSGVASFYNAGSSKWLRSGVATASSNLSTTAKTNLANAGTAYVPTVLTQSALSLSYNSAGYYASYPIQRISASSVSVVPSCYTSTTAVGVGVMTAAGMQTVATGQTSVRTNGTSSGTNAVVASDNTTIFSYTFTSGTALSAYYTTNGTTWTAGSVTGIPVFNTGAAMVAHASRISAEAYTLASLRGWKRAGATGNGQFAVFWCGARFVVLAPDSAQTNYMVSLSTNGLAWGGDNTTAVIGATVQAVTTDIQFHRNGNSCYLNVGTAYRYTTDGGVTWAASTFAAAPDPASYVMQYNTTDAAKLIICTTLTSTTAYYTADSGATWSASRTLPSNSNGGLYYKGSTVVNSTGSGTYYVSTDDGVTWTVPSFPVGVLSSSIFFYADANRFYAGVISQPQLLTSSDAVTWTIVTLPQNFNLHRYTTTAGSGIIPFDSNTVVLLGYSNASGYNQCFFTTNGGVAWTGSQYTVSATGGNWGVGSAFVSADAGGVGFGMGAGSLAGDNNTNVLKADITAGGAFYQTGATAITPLRTGAFSYVRVD